MHIHIQALIMTLYDKIYVFYGMETTNLKSQAKQKSIQNTSCWSKTEDPLVGPAYPSALLPFTGAMEAALASTGFRPCTALYHGSECWASCRRLSSAFHRGLGCWGTWEKTHGKIMASWVSICFYGYDPWLIGFSVDSIHYDPFLGRWARPFTQQVLVLPLLTWNAREPKKTSGNNDSSTIYIYIYIWRFPKIGGSPKS